MELIGVEELLNNNLLAEIPICDSDGTPIAGKTIKVKDQRLIDAVEKCKKYEVNDNKLIGTWQIGENGSGLCFATCSVCGCVPKSNNVSRFCPDCGCRMQGGS